MAGLREILVSFGIDFDTAPLDKGNAKVESGIEKLKSFGAALAGAFAVSKIAGFVQQQVEIGDHLGDTAVLLDMSTKSLEEWQYAAQFAEISGSELESMFMKLARSANSAQDAGSAQGKALKKLGVDVKDYTSTADVFEVVGTKLAGMKEGYERTALAATFFGKAGGAKVLQLFKDGKDGIAKYREEFELLGGGMGDFAKQAGDVDDAQKRLNFAWGVTKTRIAGVFLPALEWGLAKLTKFAAAVTKLIDGTHILGTALGVLAALATASAIRIVAAYLPVIAPFLAWAAAIAAIILIGEDLFAFWEGRRSLFGRVIDSIWGPGTQEKVRAWCIQVKALIGELIDKVKEIFADGTQTIFGRFQALIAYLSGDFAAACKTIFGDIGGDIVAQFLSAVTEVIAIFEGLAATVKDIFTGITDYIGQKIFEATDGAAGEAAKGKAAAAPGGKGAATGGDIEAARAKDPWYLRAIASVTGFDAGKAAPVRVPAAGSTGGGAASPFGPPAAEGMPPVVNHITVPPGTPQTLAERVGAAAHKGTAAALQAPNRAAAAGLGRTAPRGSK
jgi:hypothetical protein